MEVFRLQLMAFVVSADHIPTTLEGPFQPKTRRFDPSLRRGSDDLPLTHPRLRKKVTSNFPEQIAIALSSPSSIWVSWVTGNSFLCHSVSVQCDLIVHCWRWQIERFWEMGLLWISSGDAQIGENVTALDPSSVGSEVWCGKERGKYDIKEIGVSLVYSQLYPYQGLLNYTSGIIHHVKLQGLIKLFLVLVLSG